MCVLAVYHFSVGLWEINFCFGVSIISRDLIVLVAFKVEGIDPW